jgi:primosomal protein N' (replication factor Y)
VALGETPPEGIALRELAKVTGWGPAPDLVDLADWAARRWAGHPAHFLGPASPDHAVVGLPAPARRHGTPVPLDRIGTDALAAGRAVVRLPPAADPYDVVLAAVGRGDTLVVTPSVVTARVLAARLVRAGIPVARYPRDWAAARAGATVVGTRTAAWAPMPALAAVVVLDEHDEGHQAEQAPTWHARDVAIERARRAGVPCVLTSPVPSLEALEWGRLVTVSRSDERAGWPPVLVVDRRRDDPVRPTVLTDALVQAARAVTGTVVCVLNRVGVARLLRCHSCGELARCPTCRASMVIDGAGGPGRLSCERCGSARPPVCTACGAARFRNVRPGVARLRTELEVLLGEPVSEVTGALDPDAALPPARVLIGTEAVLHRVPEAQLVAFLDFDAELFAPRFRAEEQALALLARAARAVGGRAGGGRLLVQTAEPGHEVIRAVLQADPGRWADVERERRTALRLPPATALAVVSGPAAVDAVAPLLGLPGVDVAASDGRALVRAADHERLSDALARRATVAGKLRVEVDPRRA